VEANLIAHRRIVGRFVASGSVEKGKSVGKTEQSPKKSLRKLSLQVRSGTTLHLSENVRKKPEFVSIQNHTSRSSTR
jgi:hypothetical protein